MQSLMWQGLDDRFIEILARSYRGSPPVGTEDRDLFGNGEIFELDCAAASWLSKMSSNHQDATTHSLMKTHVRMTPAVGLRMAI